MSVWTVPGPPFAYDIAITGQLHLSGWRGNFYLLRNGFEIIRSKEVKIAFIEKAKNANSISGILKKIKPNHWDIVVISAMFSDLGGEWYKHYRIIKSDSKLIPIPLRVEYGNQINQNEKPTVHESDTMYVVVCKPW